MMVSVAVTLADLRRFAVARSLFPPMTLKRAVERLGFVQADPIRAPARAQDLTLRHRVKSYRAGDLERRYRALGIEEDFFVNYGFVSRQRPRADASARRRAAGWPPTRRATRGRRCWSSCASAATVHPREVDDALRARHGHQLLGRLVERDDAPAGAHALPRPAAGGAARARHPRLRGARDGARGPAGADAARARRRARRRRRPASTRRCRVEPVVLGQPPALRRAAVAEAS